MTTKYKYTAADRPDKKDVKLSRDFTKKKCALQKSLEQIKPPKVLNMFSTSPDGMPINGVTTGSGVHITWQCGVDGKNLPSEGMSVAEILQIAITRLQYVQQSTDLNYPVNDEVLVHLFNALVLLQYKPLSREEQGLADIHKIYS